MTLSRSDLNLPDEVIRQPSFLDTLGSIQPLGEQPKIPDVLRRKHHRYTDDEFDILEDLEPMDMLPRELIPDQRARWQPPAMWYGWEYDEDKVIEYAEAHDLLSYTRVYLPLEDDATAANGFDPELAKTCTAHEFSTDDTCMKVFMSFIRRLKIKPASGYPLKYVLGRGDMRSIFVLYGNWQLRQGLKAEDVAALVSAMSEHGLGAKPQWRAHRALTSPFAPTFSLTTTSSACFPPKSAMPLVSVADHEREEKTVVLFSVDVAPPETFLTVPTLNIAERTAA
ncbi:hypothetical protein NM688_g7832 [Phlebia brevispora]|uniref:Uncharacterized protein n=1 Tax=Phlebia brevispora TaxID=194682 RepID=A0ACC1S0R5_9APHY|nr:hypothetical protein NM688_g7832 [Phlebia brevispora]